MRKWYTSKGALNVLIFIMVVGFAAYMYKQSPHIERSGLVIFLTGGTLILIRGIVKITMGMRGRGVKRETGNGKTEAENQ